MKFWNFGYMYCDSSGCWDPQWIGQVRTQALVRIRGTLTDYTARVGRVEGVAVTRVWAMAICQAENRRNGEWCSEGNQGGGNPTHYWARNSLAWMRSQSPQDSTISGVPIGGCMRSDGPRIATHGRLLVCYFVPNRSIATGATTIIVASSRRTRFPPQAPSSCADGWLAI